MFSPPPCIMRMLYTYRKCRIFLTLSVVSCQSFAGSFPSHPPPADCYLLAVFFSISVVGRWSDSFFEIVDGLLASSHVFHKLLDSQLVKKLVRCFVGVLRPPFLSLCVPGCCPIHDNLLKIWPTSFLHAAATPA